MKKFKVQFSATYEVEVECEREDLAEECCDLFIPEDDQTKYVTDTFEVVSVMDSDGNEIEI